MARHNHLLEESERMLERTGESIAHSMHSMKKHPFRTGSVIALILGLLGLYWMLPEIRRYLRIERM